MAHLPEALAASSAKSQQLLQAARGQREELQELGAEIESLDEQMDEFERSLRSSFAASPGASPPTAPSSSGSRGGGRRRMARSVKPQPQPQPHPQPQSQPHSQPQQPPAFQPQRATRSAAAAPAPANDPAPPARGAVPSASNGAASAAAADSSLRPLRSSLRQRRSLAPEPAAAAAAAAPEPTPQRALKGSAAVRRRSVVPAEPPEVCVPPSQGSPRATRRRGNRGLAPPPEEIKEDPEPEQQASDDNTPGDLDLSLVEPAEIEAMVADCREQLREISEDWAGRVRAMQTIARLAPQACSLEFWHGEMDEHLAAGIGLQVTDLRSSVVREACAMIASLARTTGPSFAADFFPRILPALLRGLYVTIKVIRSSCDECIRAVLPYCPPNSARLYALLCHGVADSHAAVRNLCLQYLQVLLEQARAQPSAAGEKSVEAIAGAVKAGVEDGDKDVRAAARGLFTVFAELFPEAGRTLRAAFPPAVLQAFSREQSQQQQQPAAAAARASARPSMRSLRQLRRQQPSGGDPDIVMY